MHVLSYLTPSLFHEGSCVLFAFGRTLRQDGMFYPHLVEELPPKKEARPFEAGKHLLRAAKTQLTTYLGLSGGPAPYIPDCSSILASVLPVLASTGEYQ